MHIYIHNTIDIYHIVVYLCLYNKSIKYNNNNLKNREREKKNIRHHSD